jgi:ABC-type uncharacterized transport system substrate-binding protein
MNANSPSLFIKLTVAIALSIAIGWSDVASGYDSSKLDVQITIADDNETTARIVEGLQKRFPASQVISDSARFSKKKNALYVAVGPSALRTLLVQHLDGVIVSIFTSSQAYRAILDTLPDSQRTPVTAIYAEPAPTDQLRLISALYRKNIGVAVLVSDKNSYLLPTLHRSASLIGSVLKIEPVSEEDSLNSVLNRIANTRVLLAIPDNAIYNAETIRTILVTTYRRNQPVIGFSAEFVKAGALASTYSDIGDIVAQLDELFRDFDSSGKLPEPQFPKYFNVAINDHVARSLGLVVDESARRLSRKPKVAQQ